MSEANETKAVAEKSGAAALLAQLVKMTEADAFARVAVDVEQKGTQIVLPKKMTLEQGVECLQRKIKEEQTEVSIFEEVEAFPLDGAYALMQVLKKRYGWAQATPEIKQTMFGTQKVPPTMVNLEIGHNKHTEVLWGNFVIPGIDGALKTAATGKGAMIVFVITGKVKQKHRAEVHEIANEVREYVRAHSVYKGKAIRLKTSEEGDLDTGNAPGFLDISRVNEAELTFSAETAEQVQTNLFTPIERTAECRRHKVPLKRGILLEGRYGTGKTLTAYVTAKKAEQNGWTFIYLDRVTALKSAMAFANYYAPAVIFAEDIDRIVSGERSVAIDDVLNQIDGVESKGAELITILTTNYVENIEKAMLRPGRLDAVISVKAPDAAAAERLVRIYSGDLIPKEADLSDAAKELDGQIPAVIREVVERSKLAAISRLKPGSKMELIGADLAIAARGMKRHLELMSPHKEDTLSTEAAVGHALKDLLGLNGHGKLIDHTHAIAKAIANEQGVDIPSMKA